jgi:glycosyltransferase involved in cell wall biosynthesis
MNRRYRFGIILPRFGEGVIGGNESLIGGLALHLAARGEAKVEILTTNALDNRTWTPHFPLKDIEWQGVQVKRFAVNKRNLDLWVPLQIRVSQGDTLTLDEQLTWMKESVVSDTLLCYLRQNHHRYTHLFFSPYLFGLTFWGSLITPEKSILIPCLHDESFAYQDVIRAMFHECGKVIFNSPPEAELAALLYGRNSFVGACVGMGFDMPKQVAEKSLISGPYVIYCGRKETMKGVTQLIDDFIALKEKVLSLRSLKLVIVGGGSFSDLERPDALLRDDIIDLLPVNEPDKFRLLQDAIALIQPSTMESFSIVLLEAWLMKTPVIVSAKGVVTWYQTQSANGGLNYGSVAELAESIITLYKNESLRAKLGENGHRFVLSNYNWSRVLERFDRAIEIFDEHAARSLSRVS